jgi:hypothetical protein
MPCDQVLASLRKALFSPVAERDEGDERFMEKQSPDLEVK